jgi:hypothetical protein
MIMGKFAVIGTSLMMMVLWLARHFLWQYFDTPFDWYILIAAVLAVVFLFPDELIQEAWVSFKWVQHVKKDYEVKHK